MTKVQGKVFDRHMAFGQVHVPVHLTFYTSAPCHMHPALAETPRLCILPLLRQILYFQRFPTAGSYIIKPETNQLCALLVALDPKPPMLSRAPL